MKRILAVVSALALLLACSTGEDVKVPGKRAPASRHDALRDALREDARAFAFDQGDWLEDLGDAPHFGLAWLSHRKDLDPEELGDAMRRAHAR